MARSLSRITLALAALILAAAVGSGLWLRATLRGSLPQVAGERAVVGLASDVAVERDALGVVTLSADNRRDLAMALGFVHAQERFFQMDILRRSSAGELSELFGPVALEFDHGMRLHRFRDVARRVIAASARPEREIIDAYVQGVNAGLEALRSRPFEYLLLRKTPRSWRAEDSALVLLAMFNDLQDGRGVRESVRGVMRDVLPAALAEFLTPLGTPEWDAPVRGGVFLAPAIPSAVDLDLRADARAPASDRAAARGDSRGEDAFVGSNSWAVAGSRTVHGGAIVANDMHLGLAVPNIWFRASFSWRDARGEPWRVTGATLPGAPAIIVGSNGHIAWGFTNGYGDWSDLVELELDPEDPDRYRTPTGFAEFKWHREIIVVSGSAPDTLSVRGTVYGPVLDEDHLGHPRAIRWVAHDPEAVDFRLLRLETVQDLDAALDLANTCGIPGQNFVVAHRDGRIGWTVMGRVPHREGFDGSVPVAWADGSRGWRGWLSPREVPRIVDPEDGLLWTANARVGDRADLSRLGDGGYALGARARQIRDGLRELETARETDLLRIQLDDRALFLARWRELLLQVLDDALGRGAGHDGEGRGGGAEGEGRGVGDGGRRAEFRRLVREWEGRAAASSVGYRLTRAFRDRVKETLLTALTQPCLEADPRFDVGRLPRSEAPVWALVSERPPHLLPAGFASWDDLLLSAVDAVLDALEQVDGPLEERTWGERNTARITHPLGRAVPMLGRWVNMKPRPMSGDRYMPRIQSPAFGASQRMVVSPGREVEGFFHMPCGQSGHPWSRHFRDGHRAWEEGEATPFLPGPAVNRLTLRPG